MASVNEGDEPSYIDYETFLSPEFTPSSFANTLVLATNNPNDAPLDLSTPLSRVLFDIQEVDSHIDLLTTRSAIPLLSHTKEQNDASSRIVNQLDGQVKALNDSYKQLEKEVIQKHAEADEVRHVASRLWETLRLGRAVGRCLQLGRQLEVQHAELHGTPTPSTASSSATSSTSTSTSTSQKRENHHALVRCADTLLSLHEMLSGSTTPGSEGYRLDRVDVIRTLQASYVDPTERSIREIAERIVREFSVGSPSGPSTFSQAEEARARTISALHTLYLLSPTATRSSSSSGGSNKKWAPTLMLQALESYLRSALQSSIAGLGRGLNTLPTLDRILAEVTARCQNIVALEAVLESAKAPVHPHPQAAAAVSEKGNLLQPLLAHLETGSLASYFWRTMASSVAPRVQDMITRGGVSARVLRANKNAVGEAIRDCVVKGSQLPSAVAAVAAKGKAKAKEGEADGAGAWEREVAVMTGSVLGPLGR